MLEFLETYAKGRLAKKEEAGDPCTDHRNLLPSAHLLADKRIIFLIAVMGGLYFLQATLTAETQATIRILGAAYLLGASYSKGKEHEGNAQIRAHEIASDKSEPPAA